MPGLANGVAAVAVGRLHACALTTVRGVNCWGRNSQGEIGDNATTNRLPVDVCGLTSGVAAIAAGAHHNCVVTIAGGAKCWGANTAGQLGDGSTTNRLAPVDVVGLASGVVAISTGAIHSCALTTAGGAKCWGANTAGQLGDGSTTNRVTPADVAGLASDVTAVATSATHTCALTAAGGIKCWGGNFHGQLGDNSTTRRLTPVNVAGLSSGVHAIAAGGSLLSFNVYSHTCALTTGGGVKCWGANKYGELGNYATIDQSTPVDVSGLSGGVIAIAAGDWHNCALTTGGGLNCWGQEDAGQLGNGIAGVQKLPVAVVAEVNRIVVEMYNTVLDYYFITADPNEALAIDNGAAGPGWTRTGETFNSGGSTVVCRFYGSQSPGPNSHFYTIDGPECQGLMDLQFSANDPRRLSVKSWNFESFDFMSTRPIDGQCQAGTVPVYRAYNNGFVRGIDSNHRISADQAAIAQVVARGWISEGVVMCAPN